MWEEIEKWLPMSEMKDGHTYRVLCRNAFIGVWYAEKQSFLIARTKFGKTHINRERHWDTGAPYGTAKPIELLEPCPVSYSHNWQDLEADKALLAYLTNLEAQWARDSEALARAYTAEIGRRYREKMKLDQNPKPQ